MQKISYYIRTNQTISDDRFTKTYELLRETYEVSALAVVKKRSHSNFIEKELSSRKIFKNKLPKFIKFFEMQFFGLIHFLRNKRCIHYFANLDFFLVILISLIFNRKTIIDLHETPSKFLLNRFSAFFLGIFFSNALFIFCNEQRAKHFCGYYECKYLVLRNFPSGSTIKELGNLTNLAKYDFGIIGGHMPGRYVNEFVDGVLSFNKKFKTEFTILMIGPKFDSSSNYIVNTGVIPHQDLIKKYNDFKVSVIFYDKSSINNHYCEPNRFYQSLIAKKTILTFEFPTLSEFYNSNCHIIDEVNFQESLFDFLKKYNSSNYLYQSESNNVPEFESQKSIFLGEIRDYIK